NAGRSARSGTVVGRSARQRSELPLSWLPAAGPDAHAEGAADSCCIRPMGASVARQEMSGRRRRTVNGWTILGTTDPAALAAEYGISRWCLSKGASVEARAQTDPPCRRGLGWVRRDLPSARGEQLMAFPIATMRLPALQIE